MSAYVTVKPWEHAQTIHPAIWVVEIANPAKLNAMTRSMWQQLRAVFEEIQQSSQVRCVVVQGAGAAFCAGGDISEYPDFRFEPSSLAAFHEQDVWGGLQAMLSCDVPLVANISGACMGAGVEIASCCDVRLVQGGAQFGAPIAKLGFPMAPKELQLVTASVGLHTAKRMLLEAAIFSAQDMADTGWCAQPLSATEQAKQVWRTVQRIAALAPQAARLNKQTLRALGAGRAPEQAYGYAASAEHREGVAAFLAKRPARFDDMEPSKA